MASAANWASDMTGTPTFTSWARAANWLWSSVVTQAGEGEGAKAKAAAVEPGRVVLDVRPERRDHRRDDGRALAAVDVGVVDGVLDHELVVGAGRGRGAGGG